MRNLLATLVIFISLLLPSLGSARIDTEQSVVNISNSALVAIKERGVIRIGTKVDYPPWGQLNEAGAIVGLEPDLAAEIARDLGVELELVPVTAYNRTSKLNQGQIDLIIATMGDTTGRREVMRMLAPAYYYSGTAAFGRLGSNLKSWEDLRDQPVCMTEGTYYNRLIEDEYGVNGLHFLKLAETKLALIAGRCVAWIMDSTLLVDVVDDPSMTNFTYLDEFLYPVPWAMAVAHGEETDTLAAFVEGKIQEWLMQGRISILEDKWGIPNSSQIAALEQLWSPEAAVGSCGPRARANISIECLGNETLLTRSPNYTIPTWVIQVKAITGIGLSDLFDPVIRKRLISAVGYTLAVSLTSILGTLLVAFLFSRIFIWASHGGLAAKAAQWPIATLASVSRMTPPILQMYLLFFGVGAWLYSGGYASPSAFLCGVIVLSMYAGSNCALLLADAFEIERTAHPNNTLMITYKRAFRRAYNGIVTACVNVLKSSGLVSLMAVPELLSSVNLTGLEGDNAATLLSGALIFYFLLVVLLLMAFDLLKRLISRGEEDRAVA